MILDIDCTERLRIDTETMILNRKIRPGNLDESRKDSEKGNENSPKQASGYRFVMPANVGIHFVDSGFRRNDAASCVELNPQRLKQSLATLRSLRPCVKKCSSDESLYHSPALLYSVKSIIATWHF